MSETGSAAQFPYIFECFVNFCSKKIQSYSNPIHLTHSVTLSACCMSQQADVTYLRLKIINFKHSSFLWIWKILKKWPRKQRGPITLTLFCLVSLLLLDCIDSIEDDFVSLCNTHVKLSSDAETRGHVHWSRGTPWSVSCKEMAI